MVHNHLTPSYDIPGRQRTRFASGRPDTLAGAIDTIVDALMLTPSSRLSVSLRDGAPPQVRVQINSHAWTVELDTARRLAREAHLAGRMLARKDLHEAARWLNLTAARGDSLREARAQ